LFWKLVQSITQLGIMANRTIKSIQVKLIRFSKCLQETLRTDHYGLRYYRSDNTILQSFAIAIIVLIDLFLIFPSRIASHNWFTYKSFSSSKMLLLLFVQKITCLDLCHTPIDEQFYTGDITTIIRRERPPL
jgi:hypothetical protein